MKTDTTIRVLIGDTWGANGSALYVSEEGARRLRALGVEVESEYYRWKRGTQSVRFLTKEARHDPRLLQVFDDLGEEMGDHLRVVEVAGNRYRIVPPRNEFLLEQVKTPEDYEWVEVQ